MTMNHNIVLIGLIFSSHLAGMNMSMEMVKDLSPAKPILSSEKIFAPLSFPAMESYISQDKSIGCYVDRYQQGNKGSLLRSRGLLAYELTKPNQNLEVLQRRKKVLDALIDYSDNSVGLAQMVGLSSDRDGLYVVRDGLRSHVGEGQSIKIDDESWVAVDKKLINLKPGQAVLDYNNNCHFKDLNGKPHCLQAGKNDRIVCDNGDIYLYESNRLQLISCDTSLPSDEHVQSNVQPKQEVDFSDKQYLDSSVAGPQVTTSVAPDPTYLYRKVDVDDPTSTVLLNDYEMQKMHALYLEKNEGVIELVKDELNCELHHHKSFLSYARYLDPWRQAKIRRLSFVNRLLRHFEAKNNVTPSAQSILLMDPNQTIKSFKPGYKPPSLSEGTHLSHAAQQVQESPLQATVADLEKGVENLDLAKEFPVMSDLPPIASVDLEALKQYAKEEDWVEALFNEGSANLGHVVNHPLESIQTFVQSNIEQFGKLAILYVDVMSAPDDLCINDREMQLYQEKAQQYAEASSHIYNQMRETIPKMTKADFARITARMGADMLVYKGVSLGLSKGISAAGKLPTALAENEFLGSMHTHLEKILSKHPEFVTPEGVTFKAPQAMNEASALKRAADKVASGGKQSIVHSVPNMSTFFKEFEFGKTLKNSSTKLKQTYKGQAIYRLDSKLNDSMKKGYHYYLDSLHYDHLEVFSKDGVFRFVVNLDGSINFAKTNASIGRTIPI